MCLKKKKKKKLSANRCGEAARGFMSDKKTIRYNGAGYRYITFVHMEYMTKTKYSVLFSEFPSCLVEINCFQAVSYKSKVTFNLWKIGKAERCLT